MRQMAAAIMSLREHAGGSRQIEIALTPETLGTVRVRLVRMEDAGTRVEVTVARPETLAALRHDMPGLHQALDAAGIPASNREVSIQLAPPANGAAGPGDSASQSMTNAGAGENGQNRHGHRGTDTAATRQPWQIDSEAIPPAPATLRSPRRGAIDITA